MKTKTLLLAVACILANYFLQTANCFSQSPNWQWAQGADGKGYSEAKQITTDSQGNILATGYFDGDSITFGTITLINSDTTANNGYSLFVVKYDANGNVLWAKTAGGPYGSSGGSGISTDASGNVFVTGGFNSIAITFGSTTLINTQCCSNDFFIVKYDANGNVLWAKSASGAYAEQGTCISSDASGNVLVAGTYESSTLTFDTLTLTNTTTNVKRDVFVVKYDANGNVLWGKSFGGISWEDPFGISTDTSGNIFVTGNFGSSTITLGSTTLTNVGIPNSTDFFIVKYDPNGNMLWAKSAGGNDYDETYGVSTDISGNVLVTGYFISSTITFGSTTLTNTTPNSIINATSNAFVVKYDANGNVLWAKSTGGTFGEVDFGISTDAIGNVFVAGIFIDPSITFGSTILTNTSQNDTADIFIVKYDPNGNVLWAKSAGGANEDVAQSISIDVNGNVLLDGYFTSPSITFGSTTLINADSTGNTHAFFAAKLSSETGIAEENNSFNAITVFPNPATTSFTLQFTAAENGIAQLSLINLLGEKVYSTQKEITGGAQSLIDVALPASMGQGVYFLKLTTADKNYYQKIVINKS